MNISDPENSEDSSVESGDDPITSPATEPNEEQKREILPVGLPKVWAYPTYKRKLMPISGLS